MSRPWHLGDSLLLVSIASVGNVFRFLVWMFHHAHGAFCWLGWRYVIARGNPAKYPTHYRQFLVFIEKGGRHYRDG